MRNRLSGKGFPMRDIHEDAVGNLLAAARPDVPPMSDLAARRRLDSILASVPARVESRPARVAPAPRLAFAGFALTALVLVFGAFQYLDRPNLPVSPSRPDRKVAATTPAKGHPAMPPTPTDHKVTPMYKESPSIINRRVRIRPVRADVTPRTARPVHVHPADRVASVAPPRKESGPSQAAHANRPPDAELSQVLVVTATPAPIDVKVEPAANDGEGYARVAVYSPDGGTASECTIVRNSDRTESVRYAAEAVSTTEAEAPYLSVEVTNGETSEPESAPAAPAAPAAPSKETLDVAPPAAPADETAPPSPAKSQDAPAPYAWLVA